MEKQRRINIPWYPFCKRGVDPWYLEGLRAPCRTTIVVRKGDPEAETLKLTLYSLIKAHNGALNRVTGLKQIKEIWLGWVLEKLKQPQRSS